MFRVRVWVYRVWGLGFRASFGLKLKLCRDLQPKKSCWGCSEAWLLAESSFGIAVPGAS